MSPKLLSYKLFFATKFECRINLSMEYILIRNEIDRRRRLFNTISYVDVATEIKPTTLRELGLYGGAAGVWVNSEVTKGVVIDDSGVAVSILHTGKNYSDSMSNDGIDYDFPSTNRKGTHDQNEILALKNCFEFDIPLFVISKAANKTLRNVHIGLIKTFDETNCKAYIKFVSQHKLYPNAAQAIEESQADYKLNFEYDVTISTSDSSEARQKRINSKNNKLAVVYRLVQDYKRDPDVVAEALYRAKGFCEKCGEKAPFKKRFNGEPYLEVHHIIPLSKGGEDSLENVVSLCPNCHRETHFGKVE
jgi:5-methylcytosine-specific restriction endonuclease McrA